MRTIKTKLAVLFVVFMICLVLCGILLNALFLERYYIYKSKDTFISVNKKISEEYVNNRLNTVNLINLIDRLEGINCIITDSNKNVKYNSFPQKSDPEEMKLPKEIEQLVLQNEAELSKTYVYSLIEKTNDHIPKLAFLSKLESGELIILRKPLKGISESVSIANQFYISAGLVLIIAGGIFILTFSNKITKPIIEMSNVAESISNLDFGKRVIYHSQDEIGSLGKSINNISEKLSASIDDLKQDVERRKQLVRNISHELKTPIGVIKGYAEGLKYGVAEDKDKTNKYCTIIAEECDRMDGMVRELLNLSILESGMFKLNISSFDVSNLIRKVLERLEPIIIEKNVTLSLDIQKNIVVSADYELLERAVNNYIINAINYAEGIKLIKVTAEKKGSRIRISVFNTGKHIPDNDFENIWDVFYKVDKARSRQYGGHGLGLSIVKSIAEIHGGNTGLENVDEGVVFFFELS